MVPDKKDYIVSTAKLNNRFWSAYDGFRFPSLSSFQQWRLIHHMCFPVQRLMLLQSHCIFSTTQVAEMHAEYARQLQHEADEAAQIQVPCSERERVQREREQRERAERESAERKRAE